jgi:hypothetical protein
MLEFTPIEYKPNQTNVVEHVGDTDDQVLGGALPSPPGIPGSTD